MFSSKQKLFFVFLLFSLVLSFLSYFVNHIYSYEMMKKNTLDNAVKKIEQKELIFKEFIKLSSDTLLSIRESELFTTYLNSEESSRSVEDIFLAYAKSHPNFMQLRYIDKDGFEKIRVDRNRGEKPFIVKKESLQNKSNRYYFSDSKKKSLEKVWFSALDLNMEHGKLDIPYKPTLRAIYPIRNSGRFGGILIVNYLMEDFLNSLVKSSFFDIVLFDKEGFPLIHYDKAKSWGFYQKSPYTISSEFPKIFKDMIKQEFYRSKDFVSKKLDIPVLGDLYLLLRINHSFLAEQEKQFTKQQVIITLIILILSAILSFVLVRKYSQTLLNLEEIKRLNDNLNVASKIANIGFWEYDKKTSKLTWSDSVYDIFEIKDKTREVDLDKFYSYVHEKDLEKVKKEYRDSVVMAREYLLNHRIITEENSIKMVKERGKHYFDEDGRYIKSIGSVYDITVEYEQQNQLAKINRELEEINDELEESYINLKIKKEEFETIFTYSKDAIAVADLELKFLIFNNAYLELLDFEKEELLYKSDMELSAIEDVERTKEVLDSVLMYGFVENFEKVYVGKNGKRVNINMTLSLLPDRKRVLIVTKDTTSLKLLEEQSRLASIGEMIGNIAHQWRQPLNMITTSATGLDIKMEFEEINRDEIHEFTKLMVEQANYLSNTIDHFRDFIKGDNSYKEINIKDVIEKVVSLTNASIKSNFIELILDVDDLFIYGNENELEQAIINIVNNAKDALKERPQSEQDRYIFISTKKVNGVAELEILDNGCGIEESVIDRIFEPYFTTKPESVGTGLGLAMSYKIIVEHHNGFIKAQNKEYEYKGVKYYGACFVMTFQN